MFLGWISRLLASLLVPILFVAVVGFTLSQTVLNTGYLKAQLQKTNAYSKLASGVTNEIAKSSADNGSAQAQALAQLQTIITPSVLQQKLDATLDQTQNYYKHNGPVPTFDVSGLVAQTQAAGLPTPQDTQLTQPIQLNVLTKAKRIQDKLGLAEGIGAVVVGLLIIGVVTIAFVRRNFKPIANIFISLGIMVGLLGLVLYIVPSLLNKINYGSNSFAAVGHDLLAAIIHDLATRFLITGGSLLIIGTIGHVLLARLSKRSKPSKLAYAASLPIDEPAQLSSPATPRPIPDYLTDEPQAPPAASPPQFRQPPASPGLSPRPAKPPRKIQL